MQERQRFEEQATMATGEQEPKTVFMQPPVTAAEAAMRRPLMPAVRWGAIMAGVAAGISVQLVLTLFGIATGLSVTDMANENAGTAMGALLWAGTSMLVAAFIGGYVAARMSGLKRKSDGVLHGLVSWAVTTLLFASVALSAGGSLLGGIFNTMGPATMQSASVSKSPIMEVLRSQSTQLDANSRQLFQQHIEGGRREDAIELLVSSAAIDPERAARMVDQAMIVSGSAENASPQARAAAEQAVNSAGATAWVLFSAVALALAVAIAGGVLGAVGARRTTWVTNSLSRAA